MKKFKRSSEKSNAAGTRPGAAALHIDALPLEMLSHVLGYLTLSEQLKLATVSHRWRQAADICLTRCRRFNINLIPGMIHMTNRMLEKILPRLPGLRFLGCGPGRPGMSDTDPDLDVNLLSRHCPQLESVTLQVFWVDVPSLERLCHSCPKLKNLILPVPCGEACVETILRGLPKLRSLDMYISGFTGRCLSLLPPSLEKLVLRKIWSTLIDDNLDLDGMARCPALTELDVSDLNTWRSPICLVKLLNAYPRLERLRAESSDFSDDFLEQLPEKTPAIQHLNLASCEELTEAGLLHVGRLKELRSLDLFDTDTTDAVLERLQGAFNLTKLSIGTDPDLDEMPGFSTESLARLVVSCPSLRLVIPSQMVDGKALVKLLIGQLSPDRVVTVEVDKNTLKSRWIKRCYKDGRLPTDGPLRLAEFSHYDHDVPGFALDSSYDDYY